MKALGHPTHRPAFMARCLRRNAHLKAQRSWTRIAWRSQIVAPLIPGAAVEPEVQADAESFEERRMISEETQKICTVESQPRAFQQTLWRSFALGGIGLHSGKLAYVRIRPAFAGEGRYFVRVPPGTNKDMACPPGESSEEYIYPPVEKVPDVDKELQLSEMFQKYLQYIDQEGFIGGFGEFVERYNELNGTDMKFENEEPQREDPIPRGGDDIVIPAILSSLTNEGDVYRTTLANERGDRVESVEHLLAALEAAGVDNARIEIEGGPEVPTVDGSSLGWAIEIEKAGVTFAVCEDEAEKTSIRSALKPEDVIRVEDGDAFVALIPGDKMQVTYGIDHTAESALIGHQWFSWCLQTDANFNPNLAAAKTYIKSREEYAEMKEAGYLKGCSERVVIFADGDDWYPDCELKYAYNEPVRHKLLDLIGDLSLMSEGGMSGLPFGHIIAFKANHALHHRFSKKLLEECSGQYEQYETLEQEQPTSDDEQRAADSYEADEESIS